MKELQEEQRVVSHGRVIRQSRIVQSADKEFMLADPKCWLCGILVIPPEKYYGPLRCKDHQAGKMISTKPLAVLFDRDGTLASLHNAPVKGANDASWQEYNAALRFDRPVPLVVGLLNAIRPGIIKIMVSGRAEGDHPGDRRRRWAMEDWLYKYQLPIDELFMREGGDRRLDSLVKHDIMVNEILPKYNPIVAVDDRPSIWNVWEDFGLYVVKVFNPGSLPLIGS